MSKNTGTPLASQLASNTRSSPKLQAISKAAESHENGRIDEALTLLTEAQETWPDDLQIPFLIGKYLADKGATKTGIEKLESVLARNDTHLPSLIELGNIHLKHGGITKANPYIQRALETAPKDPASHCSMAALQQRIGNLPEAVEQYRTCLELQLKSKADTPEPPKKAAFHTDDAEGLLWRTLALMAKNGVHMFPAFGTLLGLTRNGGLLKHDKDIDTGIPFSEMPRAIAILQRHGWREVHHSFGLMNPRAMANGAAGISMDISGFVVDADTGKALTAGAWMPGLPKEWNMIFEFSHIHLEKRPTPDGAHQVWFMTEPEEWLETIYSDWKTPDKNFDTMVAAHNIRSFSLLAKCYGYSRIFSNWSEGKIVRARVLAQHILARDPSDHLIQKVVSRLNHKIQS